MTETQDISTPVTHARRSRLLAWIRSFPLLVGWSFALSWAVKAGGEVDGYLAAHIGWATAEEMAYQADGVIKTSALFTVEFLLVFLYVRPDRSDRLRGRKILRATGILALWLCLQVPLGMHAPSLFYCHFAVDVFLMLGLIIAAVLAHLEWRA